MKSLLTTSLILGIGTAASLSLAQPFPSRAAGPGAKLLANGEQLRFVKNMGQWDRKVRFLGRAPGVDMWITDTGVTYDYHREPTLKGQLSKKHDGQAVRISFVGAQPKTTVEGGGKQAYGISYFIGNDRSKWVSNAPVYDSATIKNLYKGVDLVAYFDTVKQMPRYDLVVHPGADASKIAMRYGGAEKLGLSHRGELAYHTMFGRVEERDLVAYQPHPGRELQGIRNRIAREDATAKATYRPVAAKVKLGDDGAVRFALAEHDRSKMLVIDPLLWSTYIGSGVSNYLQAMTAGPDGSPYIAGIAYGAGFPALDGRYYGVANIFPTYCAKLKKDGTGYSYLAQLGGASGSSDTTGMAVDANGCAFVCGYARRDFPIVNALLSDPRGSFLFKLSPDGSSLLFSTFVGGDGSGGITYVRSLTLDSAGAPILGGNSSEAGLGTPGAFLVSKPNLNNTNSFCLKLSADGSTKLFGTYFSGATDGYSAINSVAVDSSGQIYLAGSVSSPIDFPVTPGAFQTAAQGSIDGFIAKLSGDGQQVVYSTLLGGTGYEVIGQIAVDSVGQVYAATTTQSANFPLTPNALRSTVNQTACALTKLSADGSHLLYSTFLGGTNGVSESASKLILNSEGIVTVCGTTDSTNMPVTSDAVQTQNLAGSAGICFLERVSTVDGTLLYATYLGGTGLASPSGLATDGNDIYYIGGGTTSTDFPTTPGVWGPVGDLGTYGIGSFVSAINLSPTMSVTLTPATLSGNQYGVGKVTMPAVATSNLKVRLTAGAGATVPSFLVIPIGQKSATFPILSLGVNADTQVSITATSGTQTATSKLTVIAAKLTSFTVSPSTVVGGSTQKLVGTITLDAAAGKGGNTITLSTTNPDAIPIPPTLLVPSGRTSFTFIIPTNLVPADVTASCTAADGVGTHFSQSVTVTSLSPTILGLGATVLVGGDSKIGRITLSNTVSSPLSVTLTSSDSAILSVPSVVTVPAGSRTATFDVTVNAAFPGPSQSIVVTASVNGKSITKSIVVKPVLLLSLTLSPTKVTGGVANSVLLVKLTSPARVDTTVTLTSSAGCATVPATVVVPAGTQSVSVTVTTSKVTVSTGAVITASVNGSVLTKTLTVLK